MNRLEEDETPEPATWALGLGSNESPREAPPFRLPGIADPRARALEGAVSALAQAGLDLLACSSLYRTRPQGVGGDQPEYLNACVLVRSSRSPEDLLLLCEAVERQAGRRSKSDLAPRPLDLDLLVSWRTVRGTTADDALRPAEALSTARLCLPHPRLAERAFVLIPLAEIAGDFPLSLGGPYDATRGSTPEGLLEALLDGQSGPHHGVSPGPAAPSFPSRSRGPHEP